jgi:hypothetical protein
MDLDNCDFSAVIVDPLAEPDQPRFTCLDETTRPETRFLSSTSFVPIRSGVTGCC